MALTEEQTHRVLDIISDTAFVATEDVKPTQLLLGDLDIDPMDVTFMVMDLEDAFGIELGMDAEDKLADPKTTVQTVLDYIGEKL